jgi:tyrosine-specific transport protein
MMKLSHFLGAVLLVVGTTIGAAMLAIPVTTGFMGFFPSIFLFLICWLVMLFSGFFFVDVNCHFKEETNLLSMAGKTLGSAGRILCWTFYLMLLYALVAAYISGSAPLFVSIFSAIEFPISLKMAYFCLPILFGIFFYFGIKGIDLLNRVFMLGLLISYVVLIAFVPSHVEFPNLLHHDFKMGLVALPVVLTSFGFHIIIPSLGTYMKHQTKKLKKAVFYGSLLTLFVYVLWQFLVLGVVPIQGKISLAQSWLSGDMVAPLATYLKNPTIAFGAYSFAFFAIVTSFLGVALSLSDFLVDGFKIKKSWEGHLMAYCLTFIPPIFFVFKFQRGFITALEYAGVFVAVLLGIMPSLMVIKMKKISFYQTPKGKLMVYFVLLMSSCMVIVSLMNQFGYFKDWMQSFF